MAGKTGYTAIATTDEFEGPAQITAVAKHFDDLFDFTVDTEDSLPMSGNWVGRRALVLDTGTAYACMSVDPTSKWVPLGKSQAGKALIGTGRPKNVPAIVWEDVVSVNTNADGVAGISLPAGLFKNGITGFWLQRYNQQFYGSTSEIIHQQSGGPSTLSLIYFLIKKANGDALVNVTNVQYALHVSGW